MALRSFHLQAHVLDACIQVCYVAAHNLREVATVTLVGEQ